MFIAPATEYLQRLNPRLCYLLDVAIPLLLYADDAEIPADSAENLQVAASIFEEFRNDHRLFISTEKTSVTVFHDESDKGVRYNAQSVFVDGKEVKIQIYNRAIAAASVFKYLGFHVNEFGTPVTHMSQRLEAFSRAAYMLQHGLKKIPSYIHSLIVYL